MYPALILALTTSYIAWFFQHHETQALYPFDSAYTHPADLGDLRLTEERLATQDGAEVILWTAPPAPGQPVVLYLPGNAGTLANRAERFGDITGAGFGLVAMAYRGSSGSTGRPSEDRLTADAHAAANIARGLGPVVIYGESLGAALAIKLAASGQAQAVVLEAPFTTLPDLVAAQFPEEDLAPLIDQLWDSRRHIRRVIVPLMIIHGRQDRLVPQEMGRVLYNTAGSAEKHFIDLDMRGHDDLWSGDVRASIFTFLDAR